MDKKTLFIIDVYNLIYRMFYAIPEMNTRDGRPVNALFGVAKFLSGLALENPHASLIVANDVGKNFREDLYPEYKAQRDHMPDNLRSQIESIFSLFEKANIQILFREGFEADDIIGSIAHQHENNAYQIVIVSSDKDLCQFVRDGHVHIYDAMKRKFMKESDVVEKFGVPAHQVRDYLAIVGDSSDNIPGIHGFGPKKAVDLLAKYQTLEGIYGHIDEISPKMQEILLDQKNNAFLSQKLATIVTDLVVENFREIPFADGLLGSEYLDFLRAYEFRSLLPREEMIIEKVAPKITPHEIITLSELGKLQSDIQSEGRAFISIEGVDKIFISVKEKIYSIDVKNIDVNEFITFLLESDVEIVGYDLKSDLKNLLRIKNPKRKFLEGQGSLF